MSKVDAQIKDGLKVKGIRLSRWRKDRPLGRQA
jgi:hypothetical protein